MKAAFFYEPGNLQVEDCPIPEITDDELLIRVKASAICGTDLRIYKFGHFKIPKGTKRVLSHEFSGVIAKIGKHIKDFREGDRVAVPPNVGCGTCPMCMTGYNQLCADYEAFGISYDGGFQEYVRIPKEAIQRGNIIKIPDTLSFEEATIVEPFSCTYNSYQALNTKPGDVVAIIGAGPIGACHTLINKLAGASKIIVADISDTRLMEIKKIGADIMINSAATDLESGIMAATNGHGADVVITACSVPEIQKSALKIAAPRGRINFFGGMPKGKELVELNTNLIHYKELVVLGTTGSSISDYVQSMAIAASGRVDLKQLVSHRFSLDNIQEAFQNALDGKGMKTLIMND